MNKVFEMIYKLGKEEGVKFKFDSEARKIIVKDGKAVGVRTNKEIVEADVVISGADYAFTETKLLEKDNQTYGENYWKKSTLSPSAVVIYLGLKKKTKILEHHNLYFSNDWENGFKEVFDYKKWPNNPSYYIHVPSRTDASVAPKGMETIVILVPVAPYLNDSEDNRSRFFDKILNHLESVTGENIKKNIIVKRVYSHSNFIKDYNSLGGAAFGLAHTLSQSAIFRPKNRSKKVRNLFFVGQSTNPGIGVPIGILSAILCSKMIKREEL